jgi:hypothetical protein
VFAATVTIGKPNVTIEGNGLSSNFTYDNTNYIFTAGGNGWTFRNFVTDAGGINTGATTGWTFESIQIGTVFYAHSGTFASPGAPDYVVGVNTATDDVPGSTGYWVKSGSTGRVVETNADAGISINYAITALPVGGGKVTLSSGMYYPSTTINITADGVTLEGIGDWASQIKRPSGSDITLLKVSGGTIGGQGDTIRNLALYGNKDAGDAPTLGDCLEFTGASYLALENLYIGYAPRYGLFCGNGDDSHNIFRFNNILVIANGQNNAHLHHTCGLEASQVTFSSPGVGFSNLYMGQSTEDSFIQCALDVSPSSNGGWFQSCSKIKWTNGYIGGNFNMGILLDSSNDMEFLGCEFYGNGVDGGSPDLYLSSSKRASIIGNTFYYFTARAPNGVYFVGNSDNVVVTNNHFVGAYTAGVFDADGVSLGKKIHYNTGYVTESSGTGSIPSGSTVVAINHLCSYAPVAADITITFTNNTTNPIGHWWVDSITGTLFGLHVANDPGASNCTFSWAVNKH